MDATWAAVVTGSFALLMLLIEKGRRENVRDHGSVRESLDSLKEDIADIDSDIAVVESKIDAHINDHSKMSFIDFRPETKKVKYNGGKKNK